MSAIVEVRLIDGELGSAMAKMRTWLDHHKIILDGFRQTRCPPGLVVRIEFRLAEEATAFASTFGGHLLGTPPLLDSPVWS